MALDPEAWKLVHEALLDAFVTWDDLELMVAKGLNKNLHAIATDKLNLSAAVTALVRQADSEGYLPDLLRAAHAERQGNPKIVGAVRAHAAPPLRFAGATLRAAAPPIDPPRRPYPLLEAYRHPAAFTGRDRELKKTLDELDAHRLLLCLHAASGAGKTSFLQAGLLPRLRSDGVPVVINREPDEPGIARRLAAGLLDLPDGSRLADDDVRGFVHLLDQCEKLAKKAPVIVLDQFEDAFRRNESTEALARLGPLLAASTELASPDGSGFRCRWVLSYRQEYHGQVVEWLRDVLSDARARDRAGLANLPRDLSRPKYFHEMPFGPLGAAASPDEAKAVFLAAIATPLALTDENGKKRYPYQFEGDGAGRLADAFADARRKLPRAPLLPELQVVLDQRLRAAKPDTDGVAVVTVPEDVRSLVDDALGTYLEEALRKGFSGDDAKRLRALALLALRDLADEEGRRGKGIAPAELTKRLGARSGVVLSVLQEKRLVVRDAGEEGPAGGDWVLPHDQMAGVVVALWGDAEKRKRYEIDEELIALQAKVRRRMEMHRHGEEEGVALPAALFKRVEALRGSLLWDDECEVWWRACVARWMQEREARGRRALVSGLFAMLALGVAAFVLWFEYLPSRAIARLHDAKTVKDARDALDDLSSSPGHAKKEGQRLFDERMKSWAEPHIAKLAMLRTESEIGAAWEAYRAARELPGQESEANRAYAGFLIRISREDALQDDFERALLRRLRAAVSYDADTDENMREATYLASLFSNPRGRPEAPVPAKMKWVPWGRMPVASSTGFVGDYVIEIPGEKESEVSPGVALWLWSTRRERPQEVATDSEEAEAWRFVVRSRLEHDVKKWRKIMLELRKSIDAKSGPRATCLREVIDTAAKDEKRFYRHFTHVESCFIFRNFTNYSVLRDGSVDWLINFGLHQTAARSIGRGNEPAPMIPALGECSAFSPNGELAFCFIDEAANLVRLPRGDKLFPILREARHGSFSDDGRRVAVRSRAIAPGTTAPTAREGDTVVYDIVSEKEAFRHSFFGEGADVKLSPSGDIVWIEGDGFFDVDSKRRLCTNTNQQPPTPEPRLGKLLGQAVFLFKDRFEVWQLGEACAMKALKKMRDPRWAALAEDGQSLVIMDSNYAFHFFEMTDGKLESHGTRLGTGEHTAHLVQKGAAVEVVFAAYPRLGLQTLPRELPDSAERRTDPAAQLDQWQKARGLAIDPKGVITSASSPTAPPSTTPAAPPASPSPPP
jgi:hypothetical protein